MMRYDLYDLFGKLEPQGLPQNDPSQAARVKEKVWQRLDAAERSGTVQRVLNPRLTFSRPLAAILTLAAVLLTACGAAVAAEHLFGLRLFDDTERLALQQPQYAVIAGEPIDGTGPRISAEAAEILLPEYLGETVRFTFTDAGTVAGTPGSTAETTFPDFVFDNGGVAILTRSDNRGWLLQKGDTLTIRFAQNTRDNPSADETGSRMELGIIQDGEPLYLSDADELQTEYVFTAGESGTYWFYLKNYASNAIIVENVTVE